MSVANTFTFGHSVAPSLADSVDVSGEHASESSFTVAGSTTNQQEAIAFSDSGLRGIYIKTDQDLTLKTNSSGSPDDTISLKAGIPYVWVYNSGIDLPFSAAVTTTYWTNAGSTAANVYLRRLVA